VFTLLSILWRLQLRVTTHSRRSVDVATVIWIMLFRYILFTLHAFVRYSWGLWRYGPWRTLTTLKQSSPATRHGGAWGERKFSSYSFTTSALDGVEWSASRPGRALPPPPPGERTPGTQCTGGWVGPRAGLDTEARGKTLCPCPGSNPDRP
jgi:hypothetical protein